MRRRAALTAVLACLVAGARAQAQQPPPLPPLPPQASRSLPPYVLRHQGDSLYWLNEWRLPYPVYRFDVGDVDGNGRPDALVGVVKTTRFDPRPARRIFIFKQVEGQVRPLWMGSRLGCELCDFRFCDGCVRSLETDGRGGYAVADYRWNDFGLLFERFLACNTDLETALKLFNL